MRADTENVLYNLKELSNYKVVDRNMDVRGWQVRDNDNNLFGVVVDLIVNINTKRVVSLDVEVNASIIKAKQNPEIKKNKNGDYEFSFDTVASHLIFPIDVVKLDLEKEIVFTKNIDYKTFAKAR